MVVNTFLQIFLSLDVVFATLVLLQCVIARNFHNTDVTDVFWRRWAPSTKQSGNLWGFVLRIIKNPEDNIPVLLIVIIPIILLHLTVPLCVAVVPSGFFAGLQVQDCMCLKYKRAGVSQKVKVFSWLIHTYSTHLSLHDDISCLPSWVCSLYFSQKQNNATHYCSDVLG